MQDVWSCIVLHLLYVVIGSQFEISSKHFGQNPNCSLMLDYTISRPSTMASVSRAIMYSSSVGITTTLTFDSGVEMTASVPRIFEFIAVSISTQEPKCHAHVITGSLLIFAYAASEHDYVNAAHFGRIRTDVFGYALFVHF